MKTLKEKAKEYANSHTIPASGFKVNAYVAYQAGYKSAFGWTPVNAELPDSSRAILASADLGMERIFCWVSNIHEGRIVSYSDDFFGVIEATHWRKIEIPE